uniref:Reverse transcriptase domain-containing protein n=1 Tax=Tanacetum cinerariifolium TaxID=118510 RepID=A0A6L2JLG1_TANCI|nr:reverse transcriptase domain-containing protein [Tanacetum cinerariifolium]
MSAMTNITPIVTTITKAAKKEKTPKEVDAALKVNILDFCEEHYEDILSVIMDKIHRDKRKEVHARLDFGESPKKIQRVREGSQNSSAGTLPARYRNPSERPKMRDRLRYNDENMFDRLGHRKQSAFDRLSNTYSSSTTKSKPEKANSRDRSHSRGRPRRRDSSLSRDRPRSKDRLCDIKGSYEEGKANPCYLACRRAAPAIEDTRSQIQKDASLQVKKTWQCPGHVKRWIHSRLEFPPLPSYEEKRPPLLKRKVTHRGNHKTSPIGMFQSEDLTFDVSQGMYGGLTGLLLTRTPKVILAAEARKFKPPPPLITLVEKRNNNKFCDFHNDKGHNTNECVQLKKQIEELVRAGKLSHLIKEIKQGIDQPNVGNREVSAKDKSTAIYMVQPWHKMTRQKVTPSFARVREITFTSRGTEGPLVIEAEIGRHMIHYMYLNGGSSTEEVAIGGTISAKGRTKLCLLLKENLDIFAWQPSNMTRKINMKLNLKKCTFGAVEGIFLGYMNSPKGIKLYPDKTEAVLRLLSLRTIKEKCIKKSRFHCTPEAEQAFKQLKQHLSELPMLVAPKLKEKPIVYLSASREAISAVLMTQRDTVQMLVYFIKHTLHAPELNHTPMEKLVLALIFTAKSLRRYFQAHPTAVITYQPIKQIMSRPDVAGWIIIYRWISCWLILTSLEGTKFTYALRFQFTASNKEAEYEALIAGLLIAKQMGVHNVYVSVDSNLVANQVLGTYVAKKENMIKYLAMAKSLNKVATVVEEDGPTWMTPIMEYLKDGTLPDNRNEASKLRIKARQYELLEGVLYRRMHAGPRSMVAKAIRLGYYWPTMHQEARDMIRKWSIPYRYSKAVIGVKLLGRAVSRDADFISGLVMRRAVNAVDLMGLLSQLHDPQSELLLLRSCMGIAKLFFRLRTCHPVHMEEADLFFDKGLLGSIENMIVCGEPFFGDLQWRLASLPIRFTGLGLYSAKVASSYTFVASRGQSWVLIDQILRDSGICGFEEVSNREGSITERNTEGNKPSKAGVEKNGRLVIPPLGESLSTFYKEGRYPKLSQTVTYLCTMGPRIVIKSTSEEDMLIDIQETFQRFRSINMKLKPKKFSFGVKEGPFLGHLITKKGTRANPLKALTKLKRLGRVAKWAIKLGEHDIVFRARADSNKKRPKYFLIEAPPVDNRKEVGRRTDTKLEEMKSSCYWKLYTDGESSFNGLGIGLMLIDPEVLQPEDSKEFKKIIIKAPHYKLIRDSLYKKSFYTPWLRCIALPKTDGVIKEIHKEIDAIAAGNAWPFSYWGVSILGPIPMALKGLKFLGISIEHSTKWIEAKPLTTVNARHVERFVWEYMVLWIHITLLRNNQKETPFSLTYGFEAIILTVKSNVAKDERERTKELTKRKESKEVASIEEAYYQNELHMYHSKRSNHSTYKVGDFVLLLQNNTKNPQEWQCPHMIREFHKGELYKIIDASDHSLIQTAKGTNLHKFYM